MRFWFWQGSAWQLDKNLLWGVIGNDVTLPSTAAQPRSVGTCPSQNMRGLVTLMWNRALSLAAPCLTNSLTWLVKCRDLCNLTLAIVFPTRC